MNGPVKIYKALLTMAFLLGSSCSFQSDISDMKNTTKDMDNKLSETNEKLNKTNEKINELNDQIEGLGDQFTDLSGNISVMSTTMISLKDISTTTYFDLRAGSSVIARTKFLQDLDGAKGLEAKASMAAKYFLSFEFQLWEGKFTDDLAKRNELFNEGILEFFQDLRFFVEPDDLQKMNVNPASMSNPREGLYTLAALLHLLSYDQRLKSQSSTWIPMSMLGLIEQGLKEKANLASNSSSIEHVPLYKLGVLDNEALAIYLLQLRFNVLTAIILTRISDLQSAGLLTKLGMRLFDWTPKIQNQNAGQLASTAGFLKYARETRNFLLEIGETPRLSGNIKAVTKHMSLGSEDFVLNATTAKDQMHNNLVQTLITFQKEIGD